MTHEKTSKDGFDFTTVGDGGLEQIARLYRYAESLDLDADVRNKLFHVANQEFQKIDDADIGGLSPREWEIRNCDLQLRQMMSQSAPWAEAKMIAWRKFRLIATSEAAAQLVECAFLTGTVHECVDVLSVLNEEGFDYYFILSQKLREHIAYKLLQIRKVETLKIFLDQDVLVHKLSPMEHLYIFLAKRKGEGEKTAGAFLYFRLHEKEIVDAVQRFGQGLGLELSLMYLQQAETAAAAGFVDIAKRLCSQITMEDPHYHEALQLTMVLNNDSDDRYEDSFFKKLDRTDTWKERVTLINDFANAVRQRRGNDDLHRPAVNEILADAFKWVPSTPQAYAEMTAVVVQNIDLIDLLPSMLNILRERALQFVAQPMEGAFWQAVRRNILRINQVSEYWRGMAYVHLYIAGVETDDEELFAARDTLRKVEDSAAFVLPFQWTQLMDASQRYVARSTQYDEVQRQGLLLRLRVCGADKTPDLMDVEAYLQTANKVPVNLLRRFEQEAMGQNARVLAAKILQRRCSSEHYVSEDLEKVWHIACHLNHFDLAWRTATILESRGALDEVLLQPWMVSGEKRSDYGVNVLDQHELSEALRGFDKMQSKLLRAISTLGPLLPSLLAKCSDKDPDDQGNLCSSPEDNLEVRVEKVLNSQKCFVQLKHSNLNLLGRKQVSPIVIPEFMHILPNNMFSLLFVRLAERVGVAVWNWKFSRLWERLEATWPSMVGGVNNLSSRSVALAKWVQALSPEQRSAWTDLSSLANKFSDQEVADVIAAFLLRMAIMIYPAHHTALKSLRTMRAPVAMIWGFETFILSETYSEYRMRKTLLHPNPVPLNLRQIKKIIR